MDKEYIELVKEMRKELKELRELIHIYINSYEEEPSVHKFSDLLKEMEDLK